VAEVAAAEAPELIHGEPIMGLSQAFEVKESTVTVTRRYPGGEDTSETLDIQTFATKAASVSISGETRIGTMSQGGKVSVMVTVPTYVEELDNASAFASEKVREYLGREQELLAELAGPDAMSQVVDMGEALPTDNTDEAGEGAEEASTEAAEEGDEATPDTVRAFETEEELLEFCTASGLEIDMTDFAGDLDAAKEAVIAALWSEEETTEASEGDGEEVAEESGEAYTEEELAAMKVPELGEIFVGWGINNGKMPAKAKGASDKDHAVRLVKQILKFQAEALETAVAE
jgi:hypothetical protein